MSKNGIISIIATCLQSISLLSCSPRIGNISSLKHAQKVALTTLEKRYGKKFQFVDEYEGEPLDMPAYLDMEERWSHRYGRGNQSIWWGENPKNVFPEWCMRTLVEPVEAAGKPGFHTYDIMVSFTRIRENASLYTYTPEIENRIRRTWLNRPEGLSFLDKLSIEVCGSGLNINSDSPKKLSLEEYSKLAVSDSPKNFQVYIYLYIPLSDYSLKDYGVPHKYGSPANDDEKLIQKDVISLLDYFRSMPELACLYDSIVLNIRLDDGLMGTHAVPGTDICSVHTKTYDSGTYGDWYLPDEIGYAFNVAAFNLAHRFDTLYKPADSDEIQTFNTDFDMAGWDMAYETDKDALGGMFIIRCHRPVSGKIRFKNGHRVCKDYTYNTFSRVKEFYVRNTLTGKSKRIPVKDTASLQILDCTDITDKDSFVNAFEFTIQDCYPGEHKALSISLLEPELRNFKIK